MAKFFKRIVKNAVYVSRGTLWRKRCWLFEINFHFGRENFGFAAEKMKPSYQICTIVSWWAIGRKVSKAILLFLILFGRTVNIFWFFRCIILGMVIQTEFHKPRGTYNLGKILWEKFLSFPDYERNFLNIHWSLFGMLSKLVYLFIGALWERLFFRTFQNCFRTLSDNRPDLWRKVLAALPKLHSTCPKNFSIFLQWFVMIYLTSGSSERNLSSETKKFRQFCQYCILNVGELFEESFFQKQIFFNWNWILRQNVLNYQRKVSSRVVKTVFSVSSGPLWEWVSYFLKVSKVFELWAIIIRNSG